MLEHGGRLQRAAREHGIPREQWLDISTGISPFAWPVPPLPAEAWRRLPEDDDGLVDVACDYYGARHLLPVAGSQAAIQALPRLRGRSRVGVLSPGYAEHAQVWERAGHAVQRLSSDALRTAADTLDVVVLIHPNNPDGECFARAELLALHAALSARGGCLVLDEAFIDVTPEHSLCDVADRDGLIVLRSVGKFFGLAGARAGFVCAAPALLDALRESLGPWTLSGPTREVLRQALADRAWHAWARTHLREQGERLAHLLIMRGLRPDGGCALFQWCRCDDARALHTALARRGVLVRRFDAPSSLRFGLPADEAAFERLDRALGEALHEVRR
jgi:L-threonine-O-3-phosphate decarboxylase